jgi:hypothetical protein
MRAAALVFALLFLAGPAGAKPTGLETVLGEWSGRYDCGQGVTSLKLVVSKTPKGRMAARFSFGPVPENPTVPKGAYAMEGSFDAKTRRLQLRGVKWINQPSNYFMVDLDGRVSEAGDRYSGTVPAAGCTVFELRRAEALIG